MIMIMILILILWFLFVDIDIELPVTFIDMFFPVGRKGRITHITQLLNAAVCNLKNAKTDVLIENVSDTCSSMHDCVQYCSYLSHAALDLAQKPMDACL